MADLTVSEYNRVARAPVWYGRMNVWSMIVGAQADATLEDVAGVVANAFSIWFGGAASLLDPLLTYYGSTRSGPADLIRTTDFAPASSASLPAKVPTDELLPAHAGVNRSMLTLPGPLLVLPSDLTAYRATVRFAWRDQNNLTVAWPRLADSVLDRADPYKLQEIFLDRVLSPQAFAPEELTEWQKLVAQASDAAGDAVITATQPVADATEVVVETIGSPWTKAIAVGAGILGGVYLLGRFIPWRR